MMLPSIDIVLFSVLFFISTVQHAHYLYLNAAGLWLKMKWAYLSSAILNILMNWLLCYYFSTSGIIMATLIATVISGFVWQTVVIFREYFKRSAVKYLLKQMLYFAFAVVIGAACYLITTKIDLNGIVGIIVNIAVCFVISVLSILICFSRSEEFKACLNIAGKLLKNK